MHEIRRGVARRGVARRHVAWRIKAWRIKAWRGVARRQIDNFKEVIVTVSFDFLFCAHKLRKY